MMYRVVKNRAISHTIRKMTRRHVRKFGEDVALFDEDMINVFHRSVPKKKEDKRRKR